jgi:hypothetical protein
LGGVDREKDSLRFHIPFRSRTTRTGQGAPSMTL